MKRILPILLLITCLPALTQTAGQTIMQPVVAGLQSSTNVNSLNNTYNAALFTGRDMGAQVNAASAKCITNTPCHVIIPPGSPYIFSTPIVMVGNETLECTNSSVISNDPAASADNQLIYSGTEIAITMNTNGNRVHGCSLRLSNTSATAGVLMGGYSNWAYDMSLEGGGTATKVVWISNIPGSTPGAEDNHLAHSRISRFVGKAIYLDHCNDCLVSDVTAYGLSGNTTSVTLTIDTGAGGAQIHHLTGGSSGLHGVVLQNTLGGTAPLYSFLDEVLSDIPSSDGWLFDRSLATYPISTTVLNSWSAGAGNGAAGIHISGGRGITFIGNKIRANSGDGVLIDGTAAGGLIFTGNIIIGNNAANIAGHSGIRVAGHIAGLTITGNVIGNSPEAGGHQAYAFSASTDIENVLFNSNNCSNNVTSCKNTRAITPYKLTAIGNSSQTEGYLPQVFPSQIEVGSQIAGSAVVMPYSGVGKTGFAGNLDFDGTNYNTRTDSASNGAFGLLGDWNNGTSCIYAIPTNTPASIQSIAAASISNYCVLQVSSTLVTSRKPLATPYIEPTLTTAPSGSCSAYPNGTLALSTDGHGTSCVSGTWTARW